MNVIQIGCNNCDDHVFDFVSKNQNSINQFIIIDALPECVKIAKEKYSFLKEKLVAINCAISNKNGICEFFYPQNDEISAHASMLEGHLRSHGHKTLKCFCVPCLSLNCLLESFGNSIDRLYIDIEGLDATVLLGLDFIKNKIKYIEYEFTHSDGAFRAGDKHNNLMKLFADNGYQLQKVSEYNIKAELCQQKE